VSTGWLSTGGELYGTSDAARTWTRVHLPAVELSKILPVHLGSPHFFSSASGILPATLSNEKAVVYLTSDAGQSWSYRSAPIAMGGRSPGWWTMPSFAVSSPSVWGFAMLTTSTGWLDAATTPCNDGGECAVPVLLRTTNAGRTWQAIKQPAA
jgi:photosystem II stability/assembly factor-like uncharacterized protein